MRSPVFRRRIHGNGEPPGYVSNKQADVEVTAGAAVEVALTLAAAPNETVV